VLATATHYTLVSWMGADSSGCSRERARTAAPVPSDPLPQIWPRQRSYGHLRSVHGSSPCQSEEGPELRCLRLTITPRLAALLRRRRQP